MQKITTTQFLCHVRTFPIFVEVNQKNSISSTIISGISVSDLEQARMAKDLQKAGYLDVEECNFGKKKNLKYTITDAGRAASRGDEQTLTIEQAREMHDSDLAKKWGDHPVAKQVLLARGQAAQQLRLVLARTFGKDGMATHKYWAVIPCLTQDGTIGILKIADGTAWDTGVIAHDGVHDLGLVGEVYAGANACGGDCYIDNKLVQRDGSAVEDGKVIPPKMPFGWRQIGLPTWRGYDPNAERYTNVPEDLFKPQYWIKPKLVATGLMTCYGKPGTDDGTWFGECHGWESKYPWGVPPWINGQSVTLLDTMADTLGMFNERTRAPRGTDDEELMFLRIMYDITLQESASRFKNKYRSLKDKEFKYYKKTEIRIGLKEAFEAMSNGKLPSEKADKAIVMLGNETNGGATYDIPSIYNLRIANQSLRDGLPYSAAVNLAYAISALYR